MARVRIGPASSSDRKSAEMHSKPIWRVAGTLHTSEATAFTGVSLMCPNSRMSSSSGVPRVAYALGLLSQVNITTRWMADMGGCGCETDAPHRSSLASAFPARESSRLPIIGKPTQGKHPDYAWIFDGVEGDILGDYGLSGGGAAGYEMDRAGRNSRNAGECRRSRAIRRILRPARPMSMRICWGRFEQ